MTPAIKSMTSERSLCIAKALFPDIFTINSLVASQRINKFEMLKNLLDIKIQVLGFLYQIEVWEQVTHSRERKR